MTFLEVRNLLVAGLRLLELLGLFRNTSVVIAAAVVVVICVAVAVVIPHIRHPHQCFIALPHRCQMLCVLVLVASFQLHLQMLLEESCLLLVLILIGLRLGWGLEVLGGGFTN